MKDEIKILGALLISVGCQILLWPVETILTATISGAIWGLFGAFFIGYLLKVSKKSKR